MPSRVKYCVRNSHEVPVTALVCPQCGDKSFSAAPAPAQVQAAFKYCQAHGHKVAAAMLVCPQCGARAFGAVPPATTPAPTQAAPPSPVAQPAAKYCGNGHLVPAATLVCPQCGDRTFSATPPKPIRPPLRPPAAPGPSPAGPARTMRARLRASLPALGLGAFVVNALAWMLGAGIFLWSSASSPWDVMIALSCAAVAAASGWSVIAHAARRDWADKSLLFVVAAWAVLGLVIAAWLCLAPVVPGPAVYFAIVAAWCGGLMLHLRIRGRAARQPIVGGEGRVLLNSLLAILHFFRPPGGEMRVVSMGAAALGLFLFGIALWDVTQETFWQVAGGRRIEARIAATARAPEDAITYVQAEVRGRPRDARLLYLLSGLYAEIRQPLSATLVARAYQDRLAGNPVLRATEDLSGRSWRVQNAFDWSGRDAARALQNVLSNRRHIIDLFEANADSLHVDSQYSVMAILESRGSDALDVQGAILNLDVAEASGIACVAPASCKEAFKGASLWRAAADGQAALGPGSGGLALDDPDLRPLSLQAIKKEASGSTAVVQGILNVASRATIKQLYLIDFIANAPP